MALIIEPLDSSRHIRAEFSCGKDSLDRYIRQQASQDARNNITRVFVLIDTDHPYPVAIMGYYTLSSYTIKKTELEESFAKRLPRYSLLPATLLGRLAIDRQQKGQGFGELLLFDAFNRAWQSSRQVASLAVVVDAIDEDAVRFYRKYNFVFSQESSVKLYYPMKNVEEKYNQELSF